MSKLLAVARRKWGPLPVWAWASIAGTIGAVYWRLRGGGSDTSGDAIQEPAIAYGSEDGYGDTSGGNGTTPVGPDAGVVGDDRLAGIEESLAVMSKGMANMGEHLNDPGYWGVDTGAGDGADTAPEAGTDAGGTDTVKPDDPASVAKPPAKPAGVKWGGRTFTTKQGIASWLSGRGASYATWAKNHPAAAKMLKGPVPKPKPPARRPAPQPASARAPSRKAPTTGSGRAGARPRTPPKPKPTAKPKPRAPVPPRGERYVPPKPKPKPKPKAKVRGGGGW